MRKKLEKSIRDFNTTFGGEFDHALSRVISRLGGLEFFNDAQLALIREEMVQAAWDRRRRMREFRKSARAAS